MDKYRREAQMHKRQIIGYYTKYGYKIEDVLTGEELYVAGNCPHESTATVPLSRGLSIERLREFCIETGETMAEEMDATFVGAEEIKEEEGG